MSPYARERLPALLGVLFALAASGAALAQQPIPPPVKSGFPLVFDNEGTVVDSQPVAADLGLSPGFKSIIFGTRAGKLFVVRRLGNGSWAAAPGFPVQLPAHIASSPAVGDLTGDGVPEIVVGFGSPSQLNAHGGARAYRNNGTLLWEVQTLDGVEGPGGNGFRDPVYSTPAIGDVDGNGTPDVAFGGLDHRMYLVNGANGAIKPGWPRDMRDTVFSSPALHDIDGDGRLDIIIGVDSHFEGPPINGIDGGCLHVLRFDGNSVAGFPKCVDQVVASPPAVGDIDGDGRPEIVHGTGNFFPNRTHAVYAWKCDGSAVPGWPVAVDGQVRTAPALADLTGDGIPEVIVTDDNSGPSGTYHVYAFRGNGSRLFQTQPKDFFGLTQSAAQPVVGDVLGDTGLEVLVPHNGEVGVFSATGAQLTEDGPPYTAQRMTFNTQTSLGNVAVTDLETTGTDGRIEVIAVSAEPFPSATDLVVHVWNPLARASAAPPWGFFHRDEKRNGVLPGAGQCQSHGACPNNSAAALDFFTLAPCRLVDTRNAAGPRGGPALSSGGLRDFPLFACGVPASARALSLNVTVVSPTGIGFVRFSPGCQPPVASTINFNVGQTRANNAVLPIDGSGTLTANALISGSGTVHLILDVNGYFE